MDTPRHPSHHLLNVLAFVQLTNKNGDKKEKNLYMDVLQVKACLNENKALGSEKGKAVGSGLLKLSRVFTALDGMLIITLGDPHLEHVIGRSQTFLGVS
jgi:hypothetical protein